jgi:hypothetical protein
MIGIQMASLSDRVIAVARSLVTAAAMSSAVASTDIVNQARVLHRDYGEYTVQQISNKIKDEIVKTHRPGVNGTV